MTTLYAQPYDMTAVGFYFDSYADYRAKASELRNSHGDPVEEFEIQFIDGDGIDSELFGALSVHQWTIGEYFDAMQEWSREDKTKVIIAVADCGHLHLASRAWQPGACTARDLSAQVDR